jgi:hypothetical protein
MPNDTYSWKKQTKESWLSQVRKDNPGITDEKYFRIIEKDIHAKAFAFPTDVTSEGPIFKINQPESSWKIGIKLNHTNLSELKSILDLSLQHGVEYVHFNLTDNIQPEFINQLVENVYLDMITTRWSLPSEESLLSCQKIIHAKYGDINAFFDSGKTTHIKKDLAVYTFPPLNSELWAKVFSNMIKEFATGTPQKVIFEINMNNDFFLSISSIRALKLIINKIRVIYDLNTETYFEACIDDSALTEDIHSNIFKLASMSLSASISGIDFLVVPPPNINSNKPDVKWIKTSLHTQQILKHESALSDVHDPTAGSYFIEDLTEQIAGKIWTAMQQKIKHD